MAYRGKLSLRPATEADYEAVCNLDRSLFFERDYMPSRFLKYLADPLHTITIFELDGKVVGMAMNYIVDDGQTAIGQGLRILPSLRSRGLWLEARQRMPPRPPTVKHWVGGTQNVKLYSQRFRDGRMAGSFIIKRPGIDFEVDVGVTLNCPLVNKSATAVERLTAISTKRALQQPDNQWKLFPHGWLVHCFDPFRLFSSNFDLIIRDSAAIFGTRAPDSKDDEMLAMSFGVADQGVSGLVYRTDYYGNDENEAAAHLVQHLTVAQSLHRQGKIFAELYIPNKMDKAKLENILRDVKGLRKDNKKFACYILYSKL